MKIFDVFPFFNELDLLDLRLNIMDPYVDFFVLSEATTTFSGLEKPLYFEENKHRFERFSHKIIHNILEEKIETHPFERDRFQKDKIKETLFSVAADEDLIIWSDLDEIPNPEVLEQSFLIAADGQMAHLAQDVFFHYLNFKETRGALLSISGEFPGRFIRKKWLGSRVCSLEFMKPYTVTELRDPVQKKKGRRVSNGGWHFSYCGSDRSLSVEERFREKAMAAAHQELVNDQVLKNVANSIFEGKDPWGRSRPRFKRVEIDSKFPQYLRENRNAYNHMIMP